jgi:hypothetical protein
VHEIHAGGGYLSQSAPVIWVSAPANSEIKASVVWPDGAIQADDHILLKAGATTIDKATYEKPAEAKLPPQQ